MSQELRATYPLRPSVWAVAILLPIFLAALFTSPVQAQLYTGSVTGVVQDPTGAVIPTASVVLTDTAKGLRYTATTDPTGRYLLRSLPPSTYSIRVEATGFRPEVQENIGIVVN